HSGWNEILDGVEREPHVDRVSAESLAHHRSLRRSAVAIGTVAWAVALNPLNTSMMAMALPEMRHVFAVSARTSTWLLSAFAAASALGHPLPGALADRLGPRRVLAAGLVMAGLSSLAAAYAPSFPLLVAARVGQAAGTSTAFPAGLALLRRIGPQQES